MLGRRNTLLLRSRAFDPRESGPPAWDNDLVRALTVSLCVAAGCGFEVRSTGQPVDASRDDGAPAPDAPPDAPDAGPDLAVRYNLAGPAHVGSAELPGLWSADPGGLCNGSTWDVYTNAPAYNGADFHNTLDDPLFQFNYYGPTLTTCTIPLERPGGMHRVTLLFCENHRGTGCPSPASVPRVFSVDLEGQRVITDLNTTVDGMGCIISTTATAGRPIVRTFEIAVTGGTLDIGLSSADAPAIHAVEVVPL